ncbi:MAG: poly-A polymerase [Leptospiraceae bacterium]|nr:poly-A polymerase [Leptospiraceae bacterium]
MKFQRNDLLTLIPKQNLRDLLHITRTIMENSNECYLVGGAVRDLVLGKVPNEYDLTTSMLPNEVKKIFPRVVETGIEHGTVTLLYGKNTYEITTFRKDIDYIDGRRPEKIEFGVSLEEDMKRRDFTMNALSLQINSGELFDFHNGLEDIAQKKIKTIGDPISRFTEDGLRPIRAIRFTSTLGFHIEKETYSAIAKTIHVTKKIAKERFHDELVKILKSSRPSIALGLLNQNKIISLFWGEEFQEELISEADWKIIDKIDNNDIPSSLALLLYLHFKDKNKDEIEKILRNLRFSKEHMKHSILFYKLISRIKQIPIDEFSVRANLSMIKLASNNEDFPLLIENYLRLVKIFINHDEFIKLERIIHENKYAPLVLSDLRINGEILQKNFASLDKRKYGEVLKFSLELVLKNPKDNIEEVLLKEVEKKLSVSSL